MSVEKVRAYLTPYGVTQRIRELEVSSATVELAAAALGVAPARIAKTLSFKAGERPILVMAAGDARIDKILNRAFDRFGVGRCKDDRINAGGDEILKDTLLFFDVIRLAGRIVKDLHAKFAAGLFRSNNVGFPNGDRGTLDDNCDGVLSGGRSFIAKLVRGDAAFAAYHNGLSAWRFIGLVALSLAVIVGCGLLGLDRAVLLAVGRLLRTGAQTRYQQSDNAKQCK